MSALPLMRRTALMAVALAVLVFAGAADAQIKVAQTGQSTKAQRKPGLASSYAAYRPSHHSARPEAARAKTYSRSHARLSSTRTSTRTRLTPDEAGREAGAAILRQRSDTQTPRRTVHWERRRRMRRPSFERAAWRSQASRPTRSAELSDEAESESTPETAPETDESRNMESRRMSAASQAMPAPSSTGENDGAFTGTAALERIKPSEVSTERSDDETAQDDETSASAASRSREAADSALARRESDEASLVIPRSGMPAPLRGSLASLERQNDRLEAEGLERIEDEADLAERIADKLLVPIPISSALSVNPDLEENHRYCRPWTAKFLADLARAHEAQFHRSIEVSSAVRTVEYQKRLERTNGNAAPAEGDLVSPHLTGATVDIAKKGLSRAEMAWMRRQLMGLEAQGKIDVEEEFKQACFHITVYKNYVSAGKTGPATPAKPVADRTRKLTAEQVEAQGA